MDSSILPSHAPCLPRTCESAALEEQMTQLSLLHPEPSPTQAEELTTMSPGPIGTLGALPAELRASIFQHYISQSFSTGLLLTNHSLYLEFITQLYEDFELTCLIDPTDEYARVKISTSLHHSDRYIGCLGYHQDEMLDSWPVDRFKSVSIVIEAPDPADPGQLVRCWRQVTGLVSALGPRWKDLGRIPRGVENIEIGHARRSTRLPPVTVDFRDVETVSETSQRVDSRRWTREPSSEAESPWIHSVASYEDWPIDVSGWRSGGYWSNWTHPPAHPGHSSPHSDVEIILTAFLRLRGVERLQIKLPILQDQYGRVGHMLGLIEQLNKLDLPYGCHPDRNGGIDDIFVMVHECGMHLWLDLLLDDLEGPTAAIMRRQRWQLSCYEYEYLTVERLNGCSETSADAVGGAGVGERNLFSGNLTDEIKVAFFNRFFAGYQLAEDMPDYRNRDHFWASDHDQSIFDCCESCDGTREGLEPTLPYAIGQTCWLRWKYELWNVEWPEGIPRRSVGSEERYFICWDERNHLGLPSTRNGGTSGSYWDEAVMYWCGGCVDEEQRWTDGKQKGRRTRRASYLSEDEGESSDAEDTVID